ncbi:MAG: hypothetical protein V1870_02070 [Candidatus Aenigmatarchaeota archaeon]
MSDNDKSIPCDINKEVLKQYVKYKTAKHFKCPPKHEKTLANGLVSRGYGETIEEVNYFFTSHLKTCKSCTEYILEIMS